MVAHHDWSHRSHAHGHHVRGSTNQIGPDVGSTPAHELRHMPPRASVKLLITAYPLALLRPWPLIRVQMWALCPEGHTKWTTA